VSFAAEQQNVMQTTRMLPDWLIRTARLWWCLLLIGIVLFSLGYVVFGVGISGAIIQAHRCDERASRSDPTCAITVPPSWQAYAGATLMVSAAMLVIGGLGFACVRAFVARRRLRSAAG